MIIAESGDLTRFPHYRQYLNFCGFNLSAVRADKSTVVTDCQNVEMRV